MTVAVLMFVIAGVVGCLAAVSTWGRRSRRMPSYHSYDSRNPVY